MDGGMGMGQEAGRGEAKGQQQQETYRKGRAADELTGGRGKHECGVSSCVGFVIG